MERIGGVMYQKVRSGQVYTRQKALNEMIDVAERLLTASGRPLLAGARSLNYLAKQAGVRDKPPFSDDFLMVLESDCQDLPVFDDFRVRCSDAHLSEREPIMKDIADRVQATVRQKCIEILSLYHKKDLVELESELIDELH